MAIRSQLTPQNEHWLEDLPTAGEPFNNTDLKIAERMNIPSLDEDLGSISHNFVEISRSSNLLRGIGIFFGGIIGVPCFILLILLVLDFTMEDLTEMPFVTILTLLLCILVIPSTIFLLIRTDISVPRDTPVRFNRHTGKVYANEFKFTWNPFGKWPASIKVVDWSTVKAEITKQSGYNGKAYVTRYALVLASCKPGTNEVIDRIQLKGKMPTTLELYQMWRYIGLYMKNGLDGLPTGPVRDRRITFVNSFFEYMPYLNPTAKGRAWWKETGPFIGLFLAILTLPMFWILLPAGIGHYIAMKLAPESTWPPEIDAESTSG